MNAFRSPHLTGRRYAVSILPILLYLLALAAFPDPTSAQDPTVGLVSISEEAFDGYTLFTPLFRDTTYLMDLDGRIVNKWPGENLIMAYLLEDGTLLRTADPGSDFFNVGGAHGTIERLDWEGNVIWSWTYSNEEVRLHHDFDWLPNGNIIVNAFETKTLEEVHEAGGDTTLYHEGELWFEVLLEIRPSGPNDAEIVWEWHAWDHLVQNFDETKPNFGEPSDHPELLDLNQANRGIADWLHFNTVTYNPRRDEIAVASPHFNEIYVIDHSTTTEEAAGHTGGRRGKGGDLLYRWGNPAKYGLGTEEDQTLFFQHDIQWIEPGLRGEGNFILFNNRYGESFKETNHSTIDEFTPPLDQDGNYFKEPGEPFGPEELVYRYEADPPFTMESRIISGVQRLPNGNTLICSGNRGNFIEVDENDEEVWRYRSPILSEGGLAEQGSVFGADENRVFKIRRYAADFPGFAGKDLTPGATLIRALPPQVTTSWPPDGRSDQFVMPVLTWNSVADADAYRIEVSASPAFDVMDIEEDGIAETSFSPEEALNYGGVYYWRIQASNEFGRGRYSDARSFSTDLGGPRRVVLSAPADEDPNAILPAAMEWNEVEGASYDLQVATDSAFSTIVVSETDLERPAYEAELNPVTSYYWRVRASTTGPLNWSETWTFVTSVGPVALLQPEDEATEVQAYTEFAWSAVNEAERYDIQVGLDTAFTSRVIDTTHAETMFIPGEPLAYSTTYYWRVRGVRSAGPGPWSDVGSFTIAVGTAVDELASEIPDRYDLKTNFPNPFRSSTTIEYELPEAGHVSLAVYDLLGHEVARLVSKQVGPGSHSVTFNAASYPSGIYFGRLETESYSEVIRMVLSK